MTANELALQMHKKWNGKIETTAKSHVRTREDLAIAYTPGVAEPCKVIAKDPTAAYTYTMKANTIAVVSDGSAVLGLGNIGALAGMPVMEGKAEHSFRNICQIQFYLLWKLLFILFPQLTIATAKLQNFQIRLQI